MYICIMIVFGLTHAFSGLKLGKCTLKLFEEFGKVVGEAAASSVAHIKRETKQFLEGEGAT